MSVFLVGGFILCVVGVVAACFWLLWPNDEPAHDDGHCRGRVSAEEDTDDDFDDAASAANPIERA